MLTTSLTYLSTEFEGPAALRLSMPATEDRVPSHFIALTDVSESMADCDKLKHVKTCLSLLLNFMTPLDKISLVSFGENSKILLKHVKAEAAAIPMIERAIDALAVNGCTNLSAGLASVREIMTEVAGSHEKVGLLVLTDGYANRGVSEPPELQRIVMRMVELYPTLSFSFIAYGTDHNAELMKKMSEETAGKYSIVESLEGAALAMGDALGGIISCLAQNVLVGVPEGTTVEGPHKVVDGNIVIGDLYAGSQKLLLLNKKQGNIFVRGAALPLLDPFNMAVTDIKTDTARNAEVDLTRLRFTCAELFHELRSGSNIAARLLAFREALNDPFLAGNAVTGMLLAELASLEAALEDIAQNHGITHRLQTQLTQHEAYSSAGVGVTRPIRVSARVHWSDRSSPGDPGAPRPEADFEDTLSPMAAPTQQRIASQMRTRSTPAAP
jgi:Mg-chelatase subunit ChlD